MSTPYETNITIDSEFKARIPLLAPDELRQLEENILRDGCRDPLVVWVVPPDEAWWTESGEIQFTDTELTDEEIESDDKFRYGFETIVLHRAGRLVYVKTRNRNEGELGDWSEEWRPGVEILNSDPSIEGCVDGEAILIDGHNRYEICTRHGLPFETTTMVFKDRDAVELWIIENQCGRRNLPPIDKVPLAERKREILEKQAKERHKILSGTRSGAGQAVVNLPQPEETKTRDKLAADVGVSGRTYDALREVTQHGTPELVQAVRDKRLGAATAAEVAKLPEEKQREIASKETRAEAVEEAKKHVHVSKNSGNNEWYTPAEYIEAATALMGRIDLDPASSPKANETVRAAKFYTAEEDGRDKDWNGNIWMNPPYAQPLIGEFSAKLAEACESGAVENACVLVNNATETAWFQRLLDVASAVCFPRSRIRFLDPDGNPGAPLQGQAVIYMGSQSERFCILFSKFGQCLMK